MILLYISYKKIKLVSLILLLLLVIVLVINNTTTILKLFYPIKYKSYVEEHSRNFNIDPNFVYAIIKAESGFDPEAVSHRNAIGLMQLTEKTAMWGAEELKVNDFSLEKLLEPDTNIQIGCWYLKTLMKEFNNDIDLVTAAYNGGSGNVKEWLKEQKYSKDGRVLDVIPFKETERFLEKVKNYYFVYKRLYESPTE